ncbi:hypothetical protein CKM354_000368800 [Cercospora kikuchii]|uniref:PHD-type domain-containing protein n=1 Tax=Cercospora kikuchii TaxID=84275 RepID=A0A9P3CIB1_9PEZI|nr:uncharacterized protein CKM354_000368800 [Cercospora kikuchii]GIZ40345.1 hypothetical protein CKM354_000368800 [Cercospora kikuchii]
MASLASLLNPENRPPSAAQPALAHDPARPSTQVLTTTHEAAQALASLSTSPPPTQWSGSSVQDGASLERKRSWERRASAQLPVPGDLTRKPTSPTLEHFHAASRSPDHRRLSAASPQPSNIVLPPIQDFAPPKAAATDSLQRQPHSPPSSGALMAASEDQSASPGAPNDANSFAAVGSPPANTSAAVPSITPQPQGTSSAPMDSPSTFQSTSLDDTRPGLEADGHAQKAVTTLKYEHTQQHAKSPLRESSIPVPSTEDPTKEEAAAAAASRKRPAPTKKKGTASTVKKEKAPPAKKRKLETKRADTPSSRASKTAAGKVASAKGTPINSSPAPSTRSYSADPQEELDDDDDDIDDEGRSQDGDLYCICRKPDSGEFMIGCDGTCDDWFHGKCVGVAERDKNLIDKYICPACTKAGVGQTTWKRICRRSDCRRPAKAGKTKSGSHSSKYCSEECGVLYFREMAGKSRGAGDSASRRAARRKGSLDTSDRHDEDLGARGGALAAGEVKALLNASHTVDEFRKLGDGVLSPPATPEADDAKDVPQYTESEARDLARIESEKEHARQRHALLKDRMKFVTLAKQAASRVATEKELKPKEYCGYDPRIEWSEDQFQEWRNSRGGQQAFDTDLLVTGQDLDASGVVDEELSVPEICDRKKCARHMEWSKLAVDDLRFEMSDNGDRMRSLDREEHDIKDRVARRTKSGGGNSGGTVEVHGSGPADKIVENGAAVDDAHKSAGDPEAVVETSAGVVPTVEAGDQMDIDVA